MTDVDINDVMFCFKLRGRCEIHRDEDGLTHIFVYDYNNLFCYQAWDIGTPNINDKGRRTFTMPVSQYVGATHYYNENYPSNKYRPTLILNTENGGCTALTVEKMKIISDDDNNEVLKIHIRQNFELTSTKQTLKVQPTHLNSVSLATSTNSVEKNMRNVNQMFELMFTEFRFEWLNYNDFLTENGIPFKKTLQLYGGRHIGRFLKPWYTTRSVNYNFLFEDKCRVELRKTGEYHCIKLIVENPRNLCAYQGWSEWSAEANNKKTRDLKSIMPGTFVSMVNGHNNRVKNIGFRTDRYGFTPSVIFKFPDIENYKDQQYVGVITDFKMNHSLNGTITNTTSFLEMDVSLKYIRANGSLQQNFPRQILNGEEHTIFMNIDATTTTDSSSVPPTPDSICTAYNTKKIPPSTTNNPGALTPEQMGELNCCISETIENSSLLGPTATAQTNKAFETCLKGKNLDSLLNPPGSGKIPPPKKGS